MKKLLFLLLFNITVLSVCGQVVNKPVAPSTDTNIKATPVKTGKVQLVNGDAMNSAKNIAQNIAQAKSYSILAAAISRANLTETLTSNGPITIFAPDNAAFAKLGTGTLDTLLKPMHKYELTALLTNHAVAGKLSVRNMTRLINAGKGHAALTTLDGSKITLSIDSNRNIVLTDEMGGQSMISSFDVEQSNGLLHAINGVLVPKNKVI